MNYYAGIDVSLEASHVCVIDGSGKIVREARIVSEPEALIAWLSSVAELTRIGLEAGPLSQWLYAAMARASAIACGHEDAIDLDRLRHDPLMKLTVGRCPDSGAPLASQSTISRLENAPSKTQAARLTAALVDQFGTAVQPGKLEILDIDDTFCPAHGGQQLAFWNAHHNERGFASMHIYHVASGTPVVTILRPARTPKGTEVCTVIKHVTKRMRRLWPKTRIVWRGDSHYGRVEAMQWAEDNGADYIFGLAGNTTLDALVAETATNLRFHQCRRIS